MSFASSSNEDFRVKVVLALIAGKELTISYASGKVENHEVGFLKLVTMLTDDTTVRVSPDGRRVQMRPGMIRGGNVEFACPCSRGIGYYIEPLLVALPFAKFLTQLTLTGVTNDNTALSVDTLADVTLKQIAWFGFEPADLRLSITARGFRPLGGGRVVLTIKPLRHISSVDFSKVSMFTRVSGTCISCNIPPAMANRAITRAKGELLNVLSDVYVQADHAQRRRAGDSKGYGLLLWAETVTGSRVSGELYTDEDTAEIADPEAMGTYAARWLLRECEELGAPDARHQPLILLFMAAAVEDVSLCRFGRLTARALRCLRLIHEILGVRFSLEVRSVALDYEDGRREACAARRDFVVAMCRGSGLRNVGLKGF